MSNEAKILALRWLSQRSLTVREVKDRLERRGLDTDVIDAALEDLVRRGYLNDERVAEFEVRRALERHQGPAYVRARLTQRGVERSIRDAQLAALYAETDWLAIAEPLRQRYDRSSPTGRARLIRRMAREGFPASVIRRVADGERSDIIDGLEDY